MPYCSLKFIPDNSDLKDQFELESKSDIVKLLYKMNPVAFENRPVFPVKLSLDILQDDDTYEIIKTLSKKIKSTVKLKIPLAKAIDATFFNDTVETDVFIDLEKMKSSFSASGYHLLDFVNQYDYPKEVSFEDIVTCYCQLISLYEHDFRFTDKYVMHKGTEFSVVYPK